MLTSLGEKNARLFVLRKDGVPHAWDLILTSGKDSVAYYGASSNESRTFRGAEALDWWAACTLAQEGYRGLDLMGAGSTRVPSLYTVGQYKKRYAQHVTEVDGACRDLAVQVPGLAVDAHRDDAVLLDGVLQEERSRGARLDGARCAVEGDIDRGLV